MTTWRIIAILGCLNCRIGSPVIKILTTLALLVTLNGIPLGGTLPDVDVEFEKTIKIEIKAEKKSRYSVRSKISVKNKFVSQRSTNFDIYYIHEPLFAKVKDVRVRFNGKRLSKDHVHETFPHQTDAFFSVQRMIIIDLPDEIRKGQDVLYTYREQFDDICYLPPVWIPNKNRLKNLEVSVSFPKEVAVEFDFFFPWGPIEYTMQTSERKILVRFENIDWASPPVNFPYGDTRGAILIKATVGERPIIPVTADALTQWFSEQTNLEACLDSAESRQLHIEIPELKESPQVLKTVIEYTRDNLRYISDGSLSHYYVPHEAGLVLKNKYGDCKDYANFVAAAARANGVDAHMVLVSKFPYRGFPGVALRLFNHVIIGYNQGDELRFHDPTARYTKFGELPESLVGAMALVLDPNGARLLNLKGGEDLPSINITIDAEPNSLDSAQTRIRFSGDYKADLNSARVALSRADLEVLLSGLVGNKLYKIALRRFEYSSEDDQFIVYDAISDLRGFVIRSDPRTYLPKTPFIIADGNILKRTDDEMGLYFEGRENVSLSLTLHNDYSATAPDSLAISDGSGGAFNARLSDIDSTSLTFEYRYIRPAVYYEGQSKKGQLELYRKYFDARNDMFILMEPTE